MKLPAVYRIANNGICIERIEPGTKADRIIVALGLVASRGDLQLGDEPEEVRRLIACLNAFRNVETKVIEGCVSGANSLLISVGDGASHLVKAERYELFLEVARFLSSHELGGDETTDAMVEAARFLTSSSAPPGTDIENFPLAIAINEVAERLYDQALRNAASDEEAEEIQRHGTGAYLRQAIREKWGSHQ